MKKHISVFLVLCLLLICCISMSSAGAAEAVPYRVRIEWEDTPIFSGPGYDCKHVGNVGEEGVYTIIQEVWDTEGYVWGQLKSGAGWINLSDILVNPFKSVPYIQRVPDKNQPIYDGAGYHFKQVATVEKAANYTIVEEAWDNSGNLWGRLKSGAGWINLSDITDAEIEAFLQYVHHADQPIFSEPTYDSLYIGTVQEAGTYTITAAAWDSDGNYWGRLKSGLGWIDLSDVCREETMLAPVSAGYADENLLLHADYEAYIGEDAEISTYVAFRVYEDITDVCLTSLLWEEEGYEFDRILHTIPKLEIGQPFVAALPFYGDMTTYGLSFTDGSGQARSYMVYISMRNGALIFEEYMP